MGNEMRSRRDDTAEDPLAELARLMAQEDEFAGLIRDMPRTAATAQPRPAAPRPPIAPVAPPRAPTPSPRSTNQPGSFAALAAEVYAEAPGRSAAVPRSERHSLEDAARDANRSFTRPEPRAPEARSFESRAPEARSPEPRPYARPSESLKPFDRSRISDSGAQAVSNALSDAFNLPPLDAPAPRARPASEMVPPRAPARPESAPAEPARGEAPLPTWMARAATIAPEPAPPSARRPVAPPPAPPAVESRDFALDDDAYDYGRSAVATETYIDDRDLESEDAYGSYEGDEAPRPSRSRIALVGAAMAVVVIGGAGLYAYHSMSGASVTTAGQPPVIRAEQGPNKMVPTKPAGTEQAASDGQKLIYDRVGGNAPAGGERVVSSEEQPVDVSQAAQPQPRVIQPATGSTPKPVAPTNANATEPKRVRTLTVRADGSIVEDASPAPTPGAAAAPPSALAQATASTPVALSPGTGAPAPTSPTPMAATPSIVPNVPRPPTRVAAAPATAAPTAPAAAAPAASAAAAAGGFFVQVASARSEADAQTAWRAAQSKYPGVLNGQQVAFRRADLGDRGIYYRAQVGPFGNRDDANGLCQSLRAQGGDCMVQRN